MSKATWAGLGATLLPSRSASPARQGGPRASSALLTAPKVHPAPRSAGSGSQGALRPRGRLPAAPRRGPAPCCANSLELCVFQSIENAQSPRRGYKSLHTSASEGFQMKSFPVGGKKNVKGERETLPDGLGNFPLPSLGTEYLCFSRPVLPAAEGARVGFRLSTACRGSHRWGTCPVQLRLPLSPNLGKSSHLGCRKPGPWPQRGLVKLPSKGRKKAKAYNLKPGAPANK